MVTHTTVLAPGAAERGLVAPRVLSYENAPLYTLEQAAQEANVPVETIYEAVRSCRVNFLVLGWPYAAGDQRYMAFITAQNLTIYSARRKAWSNKNSDSTQFQSYNEIRTTCEFMSVAEAARRSGIAYRTLHAHTRKGLLKSMEVLLGEKHQTVVSRSALSAYLKQYHQEWPEGYHTAQEAANTLGITRQRVYELMRTKKLEYTMLKSAQNIKCRAISDSAIAAYQQRRKVWKKSLESKVS